MQKQKQLAHGGSLALGKRKVARPLSPKKALHLVLRSSKARGVYNLRRKEELVEAIVRRQAKKHAVKILQYANVGNHLHILLKLKTRQGFQNFLRSMAALVARLVTGAKKGKAFGKFWDALAYSRQVKDALDLRNVFDYVLANRIEAVQGKKARENFQQKRKKFWKIAERRRVFREYIFSF